MGRSTAYLSEWSGLWESSRHFTGEGTRRQAWADGAIVSTLRGLQLGPSNEGN